MSQATQTPAIPTPPPAATPLAQSPAALQQQLAQLYAQRAGLQAQQAALKSELSSMRIDNPGRPPVQVQDAQVALKLAQVEGDIAVTEAQLGKQGTSAVTKPPSGFDGHITLGPSIPLSLGLVLAIAVVWPFARSRAARRMRADPATTQAITDVSQRLDRMEQAIDAIAIEMERVSEGQRFMTKTFAEGGAPSNGELDAPQVRALGAGPAQPIVVPEREAVRERGRQR